MRRWWGGTRGWKGFSEVAELLAPEAEVYKSGGDETSMLSNNMGLSKNEEILVVYK